MRRNEIIKLSATVVVFAAVLASLILETVINTAQAIESTVLFVLVCVTAIYTKRAAETANAAKQQADASVKMAEEMREQRVVASRPVIIQKAEQEKDIEGMVITSGYFSHFEIYNAGKSPAIELEISLMDQGMCPLYSIRQTFLRADDSPIKFSPERIYNLEESLTYYLVSEYQSIFSLGTQQTWYQTWLPFEPVKSSREDKIYVRPGELEFREVYEKDRIDAFTKGSKPK